MATEPFVLSGLARFQVLGFFGSMVWLGSKDGHFSVAFCAALLGLDGRERRVWLGSKYWDLLEVKVLMCSLLYCKVCIWGIPLVQNEYKVKILTLEIYHYLDTLQCCFVY